ncbi:DUF3313 domain-containing protein [Azorhizobium doebereinerae]|uniref:DUF3313 domain-containing protein n=1 Tax=Azorhizobium doebereinerae TaxID=281091 RepID=UPI000409DF5B|nr:DUF3313 domain-containing protein [Azorhizobium doebereinerae]
MARRTLGRAVGVFGVPLLMAGCANAPLEQSGSLSSYSDFEPADGLLAKSKIRIDKDKVLTAKTVRIVPTVFAAGAMKDGITDAQRKLVGNAIDRSLCLGLGDRLEVVPASQPADLTVHAVVTHMEATDENAVAATKVASVAKSVLLPGIPVPTPRLPIGLGSLSMEAEARGPNGAQEAAMVWGRGANFLSGSARVSKAGDAYELAGAFGDDFSKLLVTGENPFKSLSGPPPVERFQALAGGAPKYAACDAFGRAPGVAGLVSGAVGTPPEWTDKGSGEAVPVATAAAQ